MRSKNEIAQDALRLLAERCPRLVDMCYWAGTSAMAIEELGHRESFDLDFHPEVDAGRARAARDRLLSWLRTAAGPEEDYGA